MHTEKAVGRCTVRINVKRNLLCVSFKGDVFCDETALAVIRVRSATHRLQRHFTAVLDYGNLRHIDLACAPHIPGIIEAFKIAGIAKSL